jgi:hypothetical protein
VAHLCAVQIRIKLDFLKPFECHNTAEFTMETKGGSTNVRWALSGPRSYLCKIMSIFVSMNSLVGKEFEHGLANLRSLTEKSAAPAGR